MNSIEIERKFLLKNTAFLKGKKGERIIQGYLNTDEKRAVRIRIQGEKAFITIKGKSNKTGLSRFEWEKEIAISDAEKLLQLCEPYLIEKTRYIVNYKASKFEIDVFEQPHKGLIIAELELEHENQDFEQPDWLGEEVTGNKEYYNLYLATSKF